MVGVSRSAGEELWERGRELGRGGGAGKDHTRRGRRRVSGQG